MIYLSPSAKQLHDARWEGAWLAAAIWLPIGALAGWLVHALVSGAQP